MLIFLVSAKHPCKKIRIVEAEVIKPEKWTWAVYKGRRHLLGATAFYTFASAQRAKVGYLVKIVRTDALKIIQPYLYQKATQILKRGIIE